MSLKERIRAAKTEHEVAELLKEGFGYTYASDKTRRKWARIAETKLAEIRK